MNTQMAFTPAHDKAIRSFAGRVVRRAHAAGAASLSTQDIYQELCIAWCKARDAWSEEYGVPFLAFLNRGMHHHINRWVQDQINHGQCTSLDASPADCESEMGGLHDAIEDDTALSGVEAFENTDTREYVMARLSQRARLFVDLLDKSPQFLLDAVQHSQARAQSGRGRDIAVFAVGRVTATMVFDFMGLSKTDRAAVYRELALSAKRYR